MIVENFWTLPPIATAQTSIFDTTPGVGIDLEADLQAMAYPPGDASMDGVFSFDAQSSFSDFNIGISEFPIWCGTGVQQLSDHVGIDHD